MKMIIKSKEISKVANILAKNNFTNVKDVNKLMRYLHVTISNYYILSQQKNFAAYLKFNKDFESAINFFNVLVANYNFLFKENIKIAKQDIEIEIIDGGNYDK